MFLPLTCEFLLREQQVRKSGEEKNEDVPGVPAPQGHHSIVGTSLLDREYGIRDKLKLWEEGRQKLINLPE